MSLKDRKCWLIDCLIDCLMIACLLACLLDRSMDWLLAWLIAWLLACLIDCLIDWLYLIQQGFALGLHQVCLKRADLCTLVWSQVQCSDHALKLLASQAPSRWQHIPCQQLLQATGSGLFCFAEIFFVDLWIICWWFVFVDDFFCWFVNVCVRIVECFRAGLKLFKQPHSRGDNNGSYDVNSFRLMMRWLHLGQVLSLWSKQDILCVSSILINQWIRR